MIGRDRITSYVSEIKSALETLKSYATLKKHVFLQSPIIVRGTKYCFIIAVQAAIDMYYHLAAKLVKKAPSDYANCFELLGETGRFGKESLRCMADMAKFRNQLVYHYIKASDERVFDKLKETDCF